MLIGPIAIMTIIMAMWPSGQATVCKTVYTGSIPVVALRESPRPRAFLYVCGVVYGHRAP